MDDNDKIFEEVTERELQFIRVDASVRRQIIRELRRLEREIVGLLTDDDTLTQKRLRAILAEARKLIREGYKVINEKMTENLEEIADVESTAMLKSLGAVAVAADDLTVSKIRRLVSGSLLNGAPSSEWWKRQGDDLTRRFTDEMRTGVLLGENTQQLARRVRGTRSFNFTNGIMNASRRNAEALVRSSVQNATNQARFETMETVNNRIKSYRYVATLDNRTSDVCAVRDSLRWKADTKEGIGHNISFQVPPLHWNCRSTLVPELKGVSLPDDATRASADGPVKANISFEEFLRKKPRSFVEETLGKGKAEMYLSGQITLRQLLDQSGNPLTLRELRQRYG